MRPLRNMVRDVSHHDVDIPRSTSNLFPLLSQKMYAAAKGGGASSVPAILTRAGSTSYIAKANLQADLTAFRNSS
jgi:hypothetical protein